MEFFIGLIIGIILGSNVSLLVSAVISVNKDKKVK